MTIFRDSPFFIELRAWRSCRRQIRDGARGLVKIGVNPLKAGRFVSQFLVVLAMSTFVQASYE
jgi:hypothetical protein